jgi:hypothetical protein
VSDALIVGLFTAGAALGTQGLQLLAQRLRAGDARRSEDRTDLRGLLNDAAIAARHASFALDNAGNTASWVAVGRLRVTDEDGKVLSPEEATFPKVHEYQDALADMWRSQTKLALHVPLDDRAYAAYDELCDAHKRCLATLDSWLNGQVDARAFTTALTTEKDGLPALESKFFTLARVRLGR